MRSPPCVSHVIVWMIIVLCMSRRSPALRRQAKDASFTTLTRSCKLRHSGTTNHPSTKPKGSNFCSGPVHLGHLDSVSSPISDCGRIPWPCVFLNIMRPLLRAFSACVRSYTWLQRHARSIPQVKANVSAQAYPSYSQCLNLTPCAEHARAASDSLSNP